MVSDDRLDGDLSEKSQATLCAQNDRLWLVFSLSILISEHPLVSVGDASNFDTYEEEPREEICSVKVFCLHLFFLLVVIATEDRYEKEFQDF